MTPARPLRASVGRVALAVAVAVVLGAAAAPPLVAGAVAAESDATSAGPSAGATGGPSADPSASAAGAGTTVARPPATTSVDIAPVVGFHAPVTDLVAPVADLISRTATVDGALGHDEADTRETYTLSGDVFFGTNSAALTERARTELTGIAAALADRLATAEATEVHVVGHTDSVDDDAYNQALSLDRATAVQEFLVAQVPGLPLTVEGRGETQPVAVEEGPAEQVQQARALNRRVEITATG